MRDHVTFDDERDWNRDRHGLDRASLPASGLIAFLVGAWVGGLALLLILWAIEAAPAFGKLNGCEAISAAECTIFAQEGQ